jgi:hypothetical protein
MVVAKKLKISHRYLQDYKKTSPKEEKIYKIVRNTGADRLVHYPADCKECRMHLMYKTKSFTSYIDRHNDRLRVKVTRKE